MGLGKTVQAIASLLEETLSTKKGPKRMNLVVMPTSLVFNWTEELRKFAPDIKSYCFTGADRGDLSQIKVDVVLTTYGILRRQAEDFGAIEWNYIILDEAQAIKNYKSQTASAVCSLQGSHRLSLTGTPIENNLMEMWSHMQFLNPNLLGSREQFNHHILKAEDGKADKGLQRLQKMVFRLFFEERKRMCFRICHPKSSKSSSALWGHVNKSTTTLFVTNTVRALLDNVSSKGVGGSKLKVIEGLLRLRQVACHPNLIDRNLSIPSTKLNHLVNSVLEAISENHKILIFSQFTSMLELIVRELTREQIRFTYLDGQTKDRQERGTFIPK